LTVQSSTVSEPTSNMEINIKKLNIKFIMKYFLRIKFVNVVFVVMLVVTTFFTIIIRILELGFI